MNYTFDEFNIKLTLNPSDLIIRIEHRSTKCLYESTFTESDFPGSETIGGLKAISRLIEKGLTVSEYETNDVTIRIYDIGSRSQGLQMNIVYKNIVEINYVIVIEPKRRETNEIEIALETFREHIDGEIEVCKDELRREFNRDVSKLMANVWKMSKVFESVILIPGYPVIAGDLKTLALVNEPHDDENTFCVKSPTQVLLQYDLKTEAAKHINVLKIIHNSSIEFKLISCFTNLIHLKIKHPFITDISWIISLEELLEVDFEGCTGLHNINPLNKLSRLYSINIKDTAVKDISIFSGKQLVIKR